MPTPTDIERLFTRARSGGRAAVDALFPLVYQDLHALAHRQIAGSRPGGTLSTTALVHEAYLKLAGHAGGTYQDRQHFFRVAAQAMRQILVDHARRRAAQKRGGDSHHVLLDPVDGSTVSVESQAAALVALDGALSRLSAVDARLVRVVELRFFGGLSIEETATVLEVSPMTIKRDTRVARAFLAREMAERDPG
jgi:RNA polymerase sigma factor (TIGR02999 family)